MQGDSNLYVHWWSENSEGARWLRRSIRGTFVIGSYASEPGSNDIAWNIICQAEYLSFHIIFLFKSHFKDKESHIQRGKFPSYGHPVVRKRSQFKQSGFKAVAFIFEHFKEALHQTQGSTFLYSSCGPKPNLGSYISKHSPPCSNWLL